MSNFFLKHYMFFTQNHKYLIQISHKIFQNNIDRGNFKRQTKRYMKNNRILSAINDCGVNCNTFCKLLQKIKYISN